MTKRFRRMTFPVDASVNGVICDMISEESVGGTRRTSITYARQYVNVMRLYMSAVLCRFYDLLAISISKRICSDVERVLEVLTSLLFDARPASRIRFTFKFRCTGTTGSVYCVVGTTSHRT